MSGFSGLTPSDKVNLIWEPEFLLIYYGGLTLNDVETMPVYKKRWWINRLQKELSQKDSNDNPRPIAQSRALHQNTPEMRAMQGLTREQSPSRLRRFT